MPDYAALYRQAANDRDVDSARKVVESARGAAIQGQMTPYEIADLFAEVEELPMLSELDVLKSQAAELVAELKATAPQ